MMNVGQLIEQTFRYGPRWALAKVLRHYARVLRERAYERSLGSADLLPRIEAEALVVISARNDGGADAYLEQQLKGVGSRFVFLLYPTVHGYEIELRQPSGDILRGVVKGYDPEPLLRKMSSCNEIFVNTVVGWRHVDVCDFILRVKNTCGGKMTIAFHDFNFACPSYNLLYQDRRFCANSCDCKTCLPRVDVDAHRKASAALMRAADELRFFSESSRVLFNAILPIDKSKTLVSPHQPLSNFKPLTLLPKRNLCIAIVGNLTTARGADFVAEFATYLQTHDPHARIVILGHTERPYRFDNVIVHGPFQHEELPRLLERYLVNMGFLPSICPETFSYSLQELIMLGLPVVCFNLGAQAERVAAAPRGAIIPEISVSAAYETIRRLHADKN